MWGAVDAFSTARNRKGQDLLLKSEKELAAEQVSILFLATVAIKIVGIVPSHDNAYNFEPKQDNGKYHQDL